MPQANIYRNMYRKVGGDCPDDVFFASKLIDGSNHANWISLIASGRCLNAATYYIANGECSDAAN